MRFRTPPLRLAAFALMAAAPAAAQHDHGTPAPSAPPPAAAPVLTGRFPEIAPGFYFVADSAGNLVVGTGAEGTLVIGVQEPSGLAKVRTLLDSLDAGPVRWVLAMSGDSAVRWADGGWSAQGALVFAHEEIRKKVRRPRGAVVVGGTPRFGFSHVMQLEANGEEIHVVHHPYGSTNADAIVHFETQKFLYLGALFTSDGYPVIDVARDGSLAGLIRSASEFIGNYESDPTWIEPIVPGRGPLATFAELHAWRDMLVSVRDAMQPMLAAGRTGDEVVAARPSAAFDARWGQGPVSSEAFVRSAYLSLRREAARAARPSAPAPNPDPGAYAAPTSPPAPAAQAPTQHQHQHGSP